MDIESLAKEFGGPSIQSKPANGLDLDGLAQSFGGNVTAGEPTVPQQQPTVDLTPRPENRGIPEPVALPVDRLFKNVKNKAYEVGKKITEDFNAGAANVNKGVGELATNQPATGMGDVAMGLVQMPGSLVTGPARQLGEEATNITGNPDFGSKVEFAATSGLPVLKGAKVISANIPSNKAITALVETIGKDNLAEGLARLRDNPRLSVLDVFPSVRQMGQKLITTEGTHQNIFEKAVKDRAESAHGVVESIYNNTMGQPVNVLQKLNQMKADAKQVGSSQIQPALKATGPVDLSNVIAHIDNQLKPGINSIISAGDSLPLEATQKALENVRKFITNDKSMRTDPNQLHNFQSSIRATADDLLNSQVGQDRRVGYALMDVRNKIVDAIDKASGGKYKEGLKSYRDEMQIQNAFDKGTLIARNREGHWDDRPEFWEQWVKGASDKELEAAREGARLAVDQQVNGMRFGAKKGTDIPEVEFNKDKLKLLFGEREVERMSKLLRDEKDIADTNSKLIHNSQTAMRMKADSHIDLPTQKDVSPFGYAVGALGEVISSSAGYPGIGATIFAGNAARDIAFAAKRKLAMMKNTELTKLLTSKGPDREDLINALTEYLPKPKQSLLSKTKQYALPVLPP